MMTAAQNHRIEIAADVEAMSRAAADALVEHISASLQARDVYSIVLSGGSTPRSLYALLAGDPDLRRQIPWDRVHFFWGDERHVPPDHPESNYHMAFEAMLSRVPIPPDNIHRMRGEDPDADKAAGDYAREIRRFFGIESGQIPVFNCVLLGLGADGHTASLFPTTSALAETERLVVANWVTKFQSYRITLTLPVFNKAAQVVFLVCGEDKAETLKAVLEGNRQSSRYPAQRIQPSDGELIWFLDRSAAGRLTRNPQF
jgi:6-phosphogluconolactonase